MEDNFVAIAILISILTPIVVACTEVVKRAISAIPNSLSPVISIVFGLTLAAVATPFSDLSIEFRLWGGFLAGLSACGLWDVGKFAIQKKI